MVTDQKASEDRYRTIELLYEVLRDCIPDAYTTVVAVLVGKAGEEVVSHYASTVVGEDADEELLRKAILTARNFPDSNKE